MRGRDKDGEEGGWGILFEFNKIQEFTCALYVREDQARRDIGEQGRGGCRVRLTVLSAPK